MLSPNAPSDLDEELVAATLHAFQLDNDTIAGIVQNIRSNRRRCDDADARHLISSDHRSTEQAGHFTMRSPSISAAASGAASSVEIAHDNATDVSDITPSAHIQRASNASLREEVGSYHSLQKSVDTLCSRLATIEDTYDRRHVNMRSAADSITDTPYGTSSFQFLRSDNESGESRLGEQRRSRHPEDSQNHVSSQYALHKDWCPSTQQHARCSGHDGSMPPKYFDPGNVKRWIRQEFDHHTNNRVVHRSGTRPHPKIDVIFGDEVFRVNGDADPVHVAPHRTGRPASVFTAQQRIIGGYKMAPPHREAMQRPSTSLASGQQCPSSLPRWEQVDRVARLKMYQRGWDNDRAVKGVLGKRDATSWEIRAQLDDYRRHARYQS